MISNITDNHFVDISISPRDGHYHAHDPIDIPYSLNHCFCTIFPKILLLLLTYITSMTLEA